MPRGWQAGDVDNIFDPDWNPMQWATATATGDFGFCLSGSLDCRFCIQVDERVQFRV